MSEEIKPKLIIAKTRFTDLNDDGTETVSDIGVRVMLRYPMPSLEDKSFEIVDTLSQNDILVMRPIQLVKYVTYKNDEINDLIRFAEENLDGVTVGGVHLTWDTLYDDMDYEPMTLTLRTKFR